MTRRYNLRNKKSSSQKYDDGTSQKYDDALSSDSSEYIGEPSYSDDDDSFVVQDEEEDLFSMIKSRIRDRIENLEENGWDDFMASEYMTDGWKIGLSEEKIKELEPQLEEYVEEMRNESPTVQKILESDLTRDEKKGALYKLEVLKNTDPTDPEYGKTRREIMKKLESRHPLVQKYLADKKKTWEERIMGLETTDKIKGTLIVLSNQLGDVDDAEYRSKYNKLDMLVKLPYEKITPTSPITDIPSFLIKCSNILDKELYKMDEVKKKILSFMASYIQTKDRKGCVIGLIGDPGVGKTAISRVIAQCLDKPFHQITLGSSDDVSTLLGSDNAWVGSSCGDLAHAYIKMGYSDGVISIDELDKSGKKIWNAINHIIDPETNNHITDAYLRDVPIDCSRTIFILSLNSIEDLPPYLVSRLTKINVKSPSREDKIVITKLYKIPRLSLPEGITFSDESICTLVDLSAEKGYRQINTYLGHIVEALHLHVIMKGTNFRHCPIKNFNIPFIVESEHIRLLTKELVDPPFQSNLYI